MSIRTSDLPLKERLDKELHDTFMRQSIARAQDLLNEKRNRAFEARLRAGAGLGLSPV